MPELLKDFFEQARAMTELAAEESGVWTSPLEVKLCQALLERGFEFEQSKPVGQFVLDFYLPAGPLCVEVDGKDFHHPSKDFPRNMYLWEQHGILTLRFPGWEVHHKTPECVSRIALKLSEMELNRDRYPRRAPA